jgi:hypothetical protein
MDIFSARINQLRRRARNKATTTIRYAKPDVIERALRAAMGSLPDQEPMFYSDEELRTLFWSALAELSPIRRAQDELARNDPE